MSNNNLDPTSSAVPGFVATACIALSASAVSVRAADIGPEFYSEPAYKVVELEASNGTNFTIDLLNLADLSLEKAISETYESLLANQEALGEEFSRVLYDNLEDLYES